MSASNRAARHVGASMKSSKQEEANIVSSSAAFRYIHLGLTRSRIMLTWGRLWYCEFGAPPNVWALSRTKQANR